LGTFLVKGHKPLKGKVNISGAKNAAVGIIPAALLVNGKCRLENIPDITDVNVLINSIKNLGAKIKNIDNHTVEIDASGVNEYKVSYDMVRSIRASYYLIGALLGRFGMAEVATPGGCDFGFRPIDQHVKGFEALGAKLKTEHGIIKASSRKMVGTQIYLDMESVGATINLMLAAVRAEGVTVIENAAKEPHIVDVANFLNAMGANVKGAGTDVVKITGVDELQGNATYSMIPDQIEAGTFMIAAAATGGDVTVKNVIPKHMKSLTAKLMEMDVNVIEGEDEIRVRGTKHLKSINLKTLAYPGFPTDLQPQMAVLLTQANGTSKLTEGIWPNRFQYVDELERMGSRISVNGSMAVIEGKIKLLAAPVKALDLRAGAAVVIAALAAEGESQISNIEYIDRGYENFATKISDLGGQIRRVDS